MVSSIPDSVLILLRMLINLHFCLLVGSMFKVLYTITIYEHKNITGHTVGNFKIIGREGQNMTRAIKETIYIRVNNPTLNRNIANYNLPNIWNKVLSSIPELKPNKYTSALYHLCFREVYQ